MYPITNAIKNISRQCKRYRILAPLILIFAVLTGIFMTIAVPCRMYTDERPTEFYYDIDDPTAELRGEQNDRVRSLGQSATLIQFAVMFVGAVAVFYVSSIIINERLFDVGIYYSIGLSRGQIFASLFIELFALCGSITAVGFFAGRIGAVLYLKSQIKAQLLPEGILGYMGSGISGVLCVAASVCIILLPLLILAVKLMKTNPTGFLRDRK